MSTYSHERYDVLVEATFDKIRELGKVKGDEYAHGNDRLDNFRRNGVDVGVPMEVCWRIYAGKHWDAITTYIKDMQTGTKRQRSESIAGRADDLIVYLLLFKAMVEEREMEAQMPTLKKVLDTFPYLASAMPAPVMVKSAMTGEETPLVKFRPTEPKRMKAKAVDEEKTPLYDARSGSPKKWMKARAVDLDGGNVPFIVGEIYEVREGSEPDYYEVRGRGDGWLKDRFELLSE